jgi:Ca-activated chloride channel homolog
MLLLILVMPLFVMLYIRLDRRRQRAAAQFNALGFAHGAGRTHHEMRRHVPAALFFSALTMLITALARPEMVVSLPKVEGTVILAFDVSGSMAATDLEPTRMEAAKAAARNFVEGQPDTVRIGVVAFSGSGLAVQVPTDDEAAVLAAIDRLSPESGTSVGSGILAALNTITVDSGDQEPNLLSDLTPMPTPSPTPMPPGVYTSAVVILLSDGENTALPDPLEAAQAAADRGVRIYTVGIGSPAGTELQLDGFTVHTQLDEASLQQIAEITGGTYYNAQSEEDLQEIYEQLITELVVEPQKMEITSLLVGVSTVILLIGAALSLVWFSRLP